MIIISHDAHVTSDSNGYELFVDGIVQRKEGDEVRAVTVRQGGSYHSTLGSALSAYIERKMKDMASSTELFDMKDVATKLQELKSNMSNILVVNK